MNNTSSPLETLAAIAITFAAGGVSVMLISLYGEWKRRQGMANTDPS